MIPFLRPLWAAPENVRACSTTREGGVSRFPWNSLNMGEHVDDSSADVRENRLRLQRAAQLPSAPIWLEQVHGIEVLTLTSDEPASRRADAVYTSTVGRVCAVMTADCLPVLFCSADGKEVAAAHAGWRGLQAGVLEATINAFSASPHQLYAWLGPAIGPGAFEVGVEVREAFCRTQPEAAGAFRPQGDKFFADIYHLARLRLSAAGVVNVSGGEHCTFRDSAQFFSYRRDRITGRMASLIWLS